MNRIIALLIASAVLSGCLDNKNPFDPAPEEAPDEEIPGEEEEEDPLLDSEGNDVEFTEANIPTKLAGDLGSLTYDAGSGTLLVTGLQLDDGIMNGQYTRNPSRDLPGYVAYTFQDDPLDRHFTAHVQEAANGSVRGGVVQSGGQFGTFVGGTFYERDGGFEAPLLPDSPSNSDGLVSYAGFYVGFINTNGNPSDLLTPVAPVDGELLPTTAAMVQGAIFLNVDFADMSLNGLVYDRNLPYYGVQLPDLEFYPAGINEDGTFFGEVVMGEDPRDPTFVPDNNPIGNYGGIFGGTDATGVAGGVRLDEFDDNVENEVEYGGFVLNQCGTAGEVAICDGTNPTFDD